MIEYRRGWERSQSVALILSMGKSSPWDLVLSLWDFFFCDSIVSRVRTLWYASVECHIMRSVIVAQQSSPNAVKRCTGSWRGVVVTDTAGYTHHHVVLLAWISLILSPFISIFYHFWRVLNTSSYVHAELLSISSCWSANTCMSMWSGSIQELVEFLVWPVRGG